ncbi:methylmalonyl-CoA mutase family protein [Steroidobacter sp.]|uniref:methylmalonyl-CoA mutase family protein n=1 Tax=Steroidobacter sp. TaxID=1978227 RepID=UPI001A3C3113|nr:methylmalonyl-CoA mutase family protein [Steroidobacter sp.]MBL8269435.1 methylmalonyl-CoA mutase family protein [Steroidobacter sp.]
MNTAAVLPFRADNRATRSETHPLRFVSAASLFDGHDAAINMIRRLLQAHGAEVVHLGHNRSVADIVRAAIQEDADGIAVSSYQGGHNEYFAYMVDMLREQGVDHIRVIVGGGGTIAPHEVAALEQHGVEKIYTPEDGRRMGLDGMIDDVFQRVAASAKPNYAFGAGSSLDPRDHHQLAQAISLLEATSAEDAAGQEIRKAIGKVQGKSGAPVIGLTGTGGAGKSSLNDELLQRFVRHFPDKNIAVVAMDPTRRRSGGALLGDRIRMNSLAAANVFMRSLATRRQNLATSAVLKDVIGLLRLANFDLIIVETAGIGQSDTEITDMVDVSAYVMTSEYGAASQLEKIDMLDFADMVVLNKFEKRGAEDALRDVRKQWRRNHPDLARLADEEIPVFPTIASRFNDPGVNRLFAELCRQVNVKRPADPQWSPGDVGPTKFVSRDPLIPGTRSRYLAEIASGGRKVRANIDSIVDAARRAAGVYETLRALHDAQLPGPLDRFPESALNDQAIDATRRELRAVYNQALDAIGAEGVGELKRWPQRVKGVTDEKYSYKVRDKNVTGDNYVTSLSGNQMAKIAVPRFKDWGETLQFIFSENLPGSYPYTGGVYPYRREEEDPIRMFAGEGGPERTNRRFHYLAGGHGATRLSTAFDSTTLYGEDPDTRPDIYGRTGNSGVSIATLDDMKKLYSGFDLCAPTTSVSMTINGPAPMLLAMFMNTAIDQRVERFLRAQGRWDATEKRIATLRSEMKSKGYSDALYNGDLPQGHDGSGIALLGITSDQLVAPGVLTAEEHAKLRAEAMSLVRGTVQADILKEDQAQNTCIFSTEFALRMMGDVQQFFIDNKVRNFYSVSISGYHIAEAGANPISQLAFTLSNGFTIVEYYLARGMKIDDFAPNLSFFFSNGMDPEYAVIGRVARRIWARAMRDLYGAGPRSQMLKYHVQTSGRSLHAQEIQFNDIRTTLQAMYALFDNCNSLHTNAYDEALTTPTEESVRRAVAIQLIINKELGLNNNQNPWQGSFFLEQLTDLVEEAVYREFESLSERGGVLGAMETMYQRGKIQEESMYYEKRKHDGSLPLIGVNTFLSSTDSDEAAKGVALIRSTDEEKDFQVAMVKAFQQRNTGSAPDALLELQKVATSGGNVFAELMNAVKVCSLGQISRALYEVGGQYRRSM